MMTDSGQRQITSRSSSVGRFVRQHTTTLDAGRERTDDAQRPMTTTLDIEDLFVSTSRHQQQQQRDIGVIRRSNHSTDYAGCDNSKAMMVVAVQRLREKSDNAVVSTTSAEAFDAITSVQTHGRTDEQPRRRRTVSCDDSPYASLFLLLLLPRLFFPLLYLSLVSPPHVTIPPTSDWRAPQPAAVLPLLSIAGDRPTPDARHGTARAGVGCLLGACGTKGPLWG